MRILICTDNFFPGIGGTETAVYGLATQLALDNEVMVACPKYSVPDNHTYTFDVVRLPSVGITKSDRMVLLGCAKKQIEKIMAFSPEVVHIQTVSGMAKLGLQIAKKLNVPSVMTLHTKFKDAFLDGTKSHLITYFIIKNVVRRLEKADAVTSVAACMRQEATSWGFKHGGGDYNCQKWSAI